MQIHITRESNKDGYCVIGNDSADLYNSSETLQQNLLLSPIPIILNLANYQ